MTVQGHESCYDPRLISRGETEPARRARDNHLTRLKLCIMRALRGLNIPSVMFVFLGLEFKKIPAAR